MAEQPRIAELEAALASANGRIAELERMVESLGAAKIDFLTLMNHEMRTPLNHIIGFSEVLAMGMVGALSDEQRAHVETIGRAGRYLLAIVNDVQDLTRIDSDALVIEDNIFQAGEVIDAAIEMSRLGATEKGLVLVNGGGASLAVRSDRRRVRQILVNLINNAIKFTPEGSVTVRALPRDHMIRFEVEDTGCGMTHEELELAFEEFVQMPPRSAELAKSPGAGLGLAISKRLVGLLGSAIRATSEVDRGSVFYFEVPSAES